MKIKLLFIILFLNLNCIAQIKGNITDEKGNPLPYVTVLIENTYKGTTSNEQGHYELNINRKGNYNLIFQYLGYKTQKKAVEIDGTNKVLNIIMVEEEYSLNEVVIQTKSNLSVSIIKKTIAHKKQNQEQTQQFSADFYSRGIFRIKNAPKSILGKKIDFFNDMLDSTRSGILYLSETVSKISYKKPHQLKETIIASKVSGNDNGFSFNSAASANFDFYKNTIKLNKNAVSPIADNALNYYKYKYEGVFKDENNNEIHKIKVIPKRFSEPTFTGSIYIADKTWAIYGIDLSINGSQIQNPALNSLCIKQNFYYNQQEKVWSKNTQTIDFNAGMLGINVNGKFSYVYSNYDFKTVFNKKSFGNEVLAFEENANKKDSVYWNTIRPIPLTNEETVDYLKKDLLQIKKKSKVYLDSIDRKNNKFAFLSPISGYSYKNSFKKWNITYSGILKGSSFNTVQGYKITPNVSFLKKNEEKQSYTKIAARFDYGFAEKLVRPVAEYSHKFNNKDQSEIKISGGSSTSQFNSANPISAMVNNVATLFFRDNYMKLYERNFINLFYGKEITNGIMLNGIIDYAERKPLENHTNYSFIKSDKDYTSNNPISPYDFSSPGITKSNLIKTSLYARVNFKQEYWSRPDGKFNIRNEKYPTLFLGFEKGFGSNNTKNNFTHINSRIFYDYNIRNLGNFACNVRLGKFFNAKDISFVDYKHFNGNQTHIGAIDKYLNVFNLMPYYNNSTNNKYLELHTEYDDNGFIINKIPLLNQLESSIVIGFHSLAIPERKPYSEVSIGMNNLGIGKFKIFRLDYVRAYQNGFKNDGIILGIKILNAFE